MIFYSYMQHFDAVYFAMYLYIYILVNLSFLNLFNTMLNGSAVIDFGVEILICEQINCTISS